MFFVGIFGVQQKEKEIATLEDLECKNCDEKGKCYLIKNYTYFHIFFIPIYKWNENYYVYCQGCNKVFSISKEKGKKVENGEKNVITYWDLKEIGYACSPKTCKHCKKELDSSFEYCPYCGRKLD